MGVSVITIVSNRAQHLRQLVAGLERSNERPDELVVVDMGSTDNPESVTAICGAFPITTVGVDVAQRAPLPLAAARNLGARTANHSTLLFCDVDCIPSASTVDAHAVRVEPGVVVCGPVRYLERGWQLAADDLDPDSTLEDQSALHPARPGPLDVVDDDQHELFWSLLFAVDRTTWNRLGGFDERYVGYGGEDTDLAMIARAGGVKMRWLPTGTAFHQWHPSSQPPVEHVSDIVDNANRFKSKWGWWPMHGWLQQFAERGLIIWQPDADEASVARDTQI